MTNTNSNSNKAVVAVVVVVVVDVVIAHLLFLVTSRRTFSRPRASDS